MYNACISTSSYPILLIPDPNKLVWVLWGCCVFLVSFWDIIGYSPKNYCCQIPVLWVFIPLLMVVDLLQTLGGKIEFLIYLSCFISVHFDFDWHPMMIFFLLTYPFMFLYLPPSSNCCYDSTLWWCLTGFLLSPLLYSLCWILCIYI